MQPIWHLAINSLAGRKTRTALLIAAITLSTALTVAVAAMAGTITAAFEHTIGQFTGLADLRIQHQYADRLDQPVFDLIQSWPHIDIASAEIGIGATAINLSNDRKFTVEAHGIQPQSANVLHPQHFRLGRAIESPNEVVIDQRVARRLRAKIGDTIRLTTSGLSTDNIVNSFADMLLGKSKKQAIGGQPIDVTLVGIVERPALMILQRPAAIVTLEQARLLGNLPDQLDTIYLKLDHQKNISPFIADHQKQLPPGIEIHPTATTNQNVQRGQFGLKLLLVMITVLVFLSAAFIIATSLTTTVTERIREIGALRCIGASRTQIAASQIIAGVTISTIAACLGLPLGLGLAYIGYLKHDNVLLAGFQPDWPIVITAFALAILTGVIGATYPAIRASRIDPLTALTIRAKSPAPRTIFICALLGILAILAQPIVLALPLSKTIAFWFYVTAGLPLIFIGYFLISVVILIVLTKTLGPILARIFFIPSRLLDRSTLGSPFRLAFTAGSLMVGLAMLLTIWIGGRSIMAGYFDNLKMPDGFIHSFFSLPPDQVDRINAIESIDIACPTTMFPVEPINRAFGIDGISPRNTLFVSFEPHTFIQLTELDWDQGNPTDALAALDAGTSILVSKEYRIAHGLGIGDTITINTPVEGPVDFNIAGVVTSPGLDVAVQLFGINQYYADAAISSIMGTRADAKRYFNTDATNLVLLRYADGITGEQVQRDVYKNLSGIVFGDSSAIRAIVNESAERFMGIASSFAIVTLFIACFGVSNIVVANLTARRFEYGVIRAVGAQQFMLVRWVIAELVLLALVACILGTALGIQLVTIGRIFHRRLVGITYDTQIPWDITAYGWLIVIAITIAAALPSLIRLVSTTPRSLLAARLN